jgi:hypothetical protein
MIDIAKVLAALGGARPVFHSEDDFRRALSLALQRSLPDASIQMKYPIGEDRRTYVDIWVEHDGAVLAIELKYKTQLLAVEHAGEQFRLKQHGAQDLARYDFIRDIERLERIVRERNDITGIAILLTNDHRYWSAGRENAFDAAFRIWEGRLLHDTLQWDEATGSGTTKGRERPLQLYGMYRLRWSDYSRVAHENAGTFRYVAVEINAGYEAEDVTGKPFTTRDSLWNIVGIGQSDREVNVSENKYAHLIPAYSNNRR